MFRLPEASTEAIFYGSNLAQCLYLNGIDYGYIVTVTHLCQNIRVLDCACRILWIRSNWVGTMFEKVEAGRVTLVDLLISLGSAGLAFFSLPTVLNKASQVPRRTASIPTAATLTYFIPLFAISGLVLTSITIAGQAIVWWLIVAFRPVKKTK